jgi:hypothetical protein
MQRAYNLPMYYAQRSHDNTVRKPDLYQLLDKPEKLAEQLTKKLEQDEIRHKKNIAFFDELGWKTEV